MPRDLADYLAGNVLLQCGRTCSPFKFIVFETMKKADNEVLGNRLFGWIFLDFLGQRYQENIWDEEDF